MTPSPSSRGASGAALFERLAVLHRPDCAALGAPGPVAAEDLPDAEAVARVLGSEAAGRYGMAARDIYEDLRRVVGQLAGFLILVRLTERPDLPDLADFKACAARWRRAGEGLAGLTPPGPLAGHRDALALSHRLCGQLLETLPGWSRSLEREAAFERMSAAIRGAYSALQAASSERAGLRMVDLSHACCTCGQAS